MKKSRMRPVMSLFLAAVLITSSVPAMASTASAATCYNAPAAIAKAKATVNSSAELCAGFVSNCIKAGGAKSWNRGCTSLVRELVENKEGNLIELSMNANGSIPLAGNSTKIAAGDLIFYKCNSVDACYVHTALYSGEASGDRMKGYATNSRVNNGVLWYPKCGYCGSSKVSAYAFHFSGNGNAASTVVKAAPTGFRINTALSGANSTFSWNSVNSAVSYDVEIYNNSGSLLHKQSAVRGTSFTYRFASPGGYHAYVCSVFPDKSWKWSERLNFTISTGQTSVSTLKTPIEAYTVFNGTTKLPTSGELWATDYCIIKQISGPSALVSYPVGNGRVERWVASSIFFNGTAVKPVTTKYATAYRRPTGSAYIGHTYEGDKCFQIGEPVGSRIQVVYPVTGTNRYMMGWIDKSHLK